MPQVPDIRDSAKHILTEVTEALVRAMRATPDDKLRWSPGGAARSALAIFVECATSNMWFARLLRAEEVSGFPEADASQFPDLQSALDLMEESHRQVLEAISAVEDAGLTRELTMPWGERMSIAQLLFLPSYHIDYHYGQVNYLQTIWGDTEMH